VIYLGFYWIEQRKGKRIWGNGWSLLKFSSAKEEEEAGAKKNPPSIFQPCSSTSLAVNKQAYPIPSRKRISRDFSAGHLFFYLFL